MHYFRNALIINTISNTADNDRIPHFIIINHFQLLLVGSICPKEKFIHGVPDTEGQEQEHQSQQL
jgi:hypothetical protein